MKILKLTLKKKWFDMILSGGKNHEYREIKPYWISRLTNQRSFTARPQSVWKFKEFNAIQFRNGYSPKSATIFVECLGIEIGKGDPNWGAPTSDVFILKIGKLINPPSL